MIECSEYTEYCYFLTSNNGPKNINRYDADGVWEEDWQIDGFFSIMKIYRYFTLITLSGNKISTVDFSKSEASGNYLISTFNSPASLQIAPMIGDYIAV